VFNVRRPLTPDVSLDKQRGIASRWFEVHSCPEFPIRLPVRYLFTRVSVYADTFRIEQYRRLDSPPEVPVWGLLQLENYLKSERVPGSRRPANL
jgi:hypothetical protein